MAFDFDESGALVANTPGFDFNDQGELVSGKVAQEPTPDESTFGALKRGATEAFQQLPQLARGIQAGIGAAGETAFGEGGTFTDIKKSGIAGYEDWGNKISKNSQQSDSIDYSWEKAKEGDFGSLVNWLSHGLGYVGGQAVQTLATGGIGAIGGKFVAGTAAKQIAEGMVAKEVATITAANVGKDIAEDQILKAATTNVAAKFANIGMTTAMAANATGMEGGEIFGGLASKDPNKVLSGEELGKAFASTLAAGGLEFVGDKLGLDLMLGKSKLLKPAESMAGLGGRAARGLIAGGAAMPIEAGTEYLQTGLEEFGKGNESNILPFNQSEEAQKQAREGAALGAFGGAVMGGASGALRGAKAKPTDVLKADNIDDAITLSQAAIDAGSQWQDIVAQKAAKEQADAAEAQARFDRRMEEGRKLNAMRDDRINAVGALAKPIVDGLEADKADLNDLVQSETRNKQVMLAQLEQDRIKQEQMDQMPGMARAATLDAPTAMQSAFERLQKPEPPPTESAIPTQTPAQPAGVSTSTVETQLPRIVERTPSMVAMPRKLAEQTAAKSDAEVVRIQNKNGKFAFTVIPKANDVPINEQDAEQGTNTPAVEAPREAPKAVASNAAATQGLPTAGNPTVEGVRVNQIQAKAEQAPVATNDVATDSIDGEIENLRRIEAINQRQGLNLDVNGMASDALKASGRLHEVKQPNNTPAAPTGAPIGVTQQNNTAKPGNAVIEATSILQPLGTPNAQTAQAQQVQPQAPTSQTDQRLIPVSQRAMTRAKQIESGPSVVLQNRDRSSAASIAQMNDIASKPDYLRAGQSSVMDSGAPVVFGDIPNTAIIGKSQPIADGKGQRTQITYAVIEATDLIASHLADGTTVPSYANGEAGKLRAVAGNGRAAGITEGYNRGTTDQYKQDLINDASGMGMDAQAITAMKAPILVRVMDKADVTSDIADRSNISNTARLSSVEQASTDSKRLDLTSLEFHDSGEPTNAAVTQFVRSMPTSEQSELIAPDGTPTRQAVDRLMAATFKQAYGSDELVGLYSQAQDSEAKTVMSGLADAAGSMSSLKDAGEHDIRGAIAEAAGFAVNARRQGQKLSDMLKTRDMTMSDEALVVAQFMADNVRSAKKISEGLRNVAEYAAEQAQIVRDNASQGGMFGETPAASRYDIFRRLNGNKDITPQENNIQQPTRTTEIEGVTERTPTSGEAVEPAGITSSDRSLPQAPKDPVIEANQAKIDEAKSIKYPLPYLAKLITEEKLDPTDKFHMHLLDNALPQSRAYNRLMTEHNGDFKGIEFSDERNPEKFAFVLPDASQVGKWRISYFDKHGLSSHHVEDTQEKAQQSLVTDHFTVNAAGTLDKFSATKEWARGTEYAALIQKMNTGELTLAQFSEEQRKLNDKYDENKSEGLTATTPEQVKADEERTAQIEKDKAKADKDAEEKAKSERIQKEIQARQQASAENFHLGQSAEDSLAGQGSVFDAPAEKPASEMTVADHLREAAKKTEEQTPAKRFEIGKALTKEQRKAVLKTLVDVYKAKGAPREMKGQDQNGNERSGYVYSPELFEKSDITGAMVRYYVTLPDGRMAHPSELFEGYTQADIDNEISRRESAEKRIREIARGQYLKDQFDTKREASAYWNDKSDKSTKTAQGKPTIYGALERTHITDGNKFAMIPTDVLSNQDMMDAIKAEGWDVAQATTVAAVDARKGVMMSRSGVSQVTEPTEVTHNGIRIYKTKVNIGGKAIDKWAVQSLNNAEREKDGKRQLGGDALADTIDEAKILAEQEIAGAEIVQAYRAKMANQDAEQQKEKDLAQAKKDANKGKTIVEHRKDAILDGATRLPMQAGLGIGTKRETMQKAVDQDRAIVMKMVDDTAAKKRDQEFIDRNRNLPIGNINYPGVKEYMEVVARKKTDNYEKPSYRVYSGHDTNSSFYEISKTEYDYAQELKAKLAEQSIPKTETTGKPAQPSAQEPEASSDEPIPAITEAQARKQFEWRNMVQKDGTKSHRLFWFEREADKGTGQAMGYGEVSLYPGASGWKIEDGDGTSYPSLAAAKAAAIDLAMPRLQENGYVLKPAQADKPSAIGDFGEKIGGAKKDTWTGFKDGLSAVSDDDIAGRKLSEIWPAPDYQKMIDDGMDAKSVALIRSIRDEVPAKPRTDYKVKRWAEQVKEGRALALSIINEKEKSDKLYNELTRIGGKLSSIAGRSDLYMAVGHDKSLEGIRFANHHYSLYKGRENVNLWVIERDAAATAFSNFPQELATGDTKEQAIGAFKAKYDSLDQTAAVKKAEFVIFAQDGKYFVGKKIGRNIATMSGPFSSVKEAREYRQNNLTELEAKLAKYKEIPKERRDTNEPRVGEDMRNGQDVTPEMFAESFGFKGVEFGNWVEQKRRQKDLNDAFDSLMDMAAIIGVPARAISLNGELSLAFGARGSGGVNPAAAHYESDKIVINLTKREGAGSLGHEFWHALDNYFSRMRGNRTSSFMTTATDVGLSSSGSNYFAYEGVRKEMIDAFGEVVRQIKMTAMKARSSKIDAKRTKEYWTTGEEMAARAFESYLISKLHDQNASNDYLANIVNQKTWDAMAALGMENEDSYPYPTAGEMPGIRAGFDKFFQTLETKETDKGVAMFSRGENPTGLSVKSVQDITDAIKARWANAPEVVVAENMDDAAIPQAVRDHDAEQRSQGATGSPEGFFYGGKVYVVANQMNTPGDVVRVMFHETLGHAGLRGVFGADLNKILRQIVMLRRKDIISKARSYGLVRTDKNGNPVVDVKTATDAEVFAAMDESHKLTSAEEVLAEMAQTKPEIGFVKRAIAAIRAFLRKNVPGFEAMKLTDAEIINSYIIPARKFVESGRGKSGGALAFMRVYHGSPHHFVKFDSSKIGTGEGAQAYGYGLYLADSPDVAKSYQNLASITQSGQSTRQFNVDGKLTNLSEYASRSPYNEAVWGRLDDYIKQWETYPAQHPGNEAAKALADRILQKARDLVGKKVEAVDQVGSLYKVDLPDEYIAKMLNYDAPLSEQHPDVQAIFGNSNKMTGAQALKAIEANPEQYFSQIMSGKDLTGAMIRPERGSSEFLKQKGVPGIRYLDGDSRGAGAGTSNYVIFPGMEHILTIIDINGKPVVGAEKKSAIESLSKSTAPDSVGAMFSRTKIIGETTRQHTPEQLRAMKNVGFQVEVPTLAERAKALYQDAGKKLAQGIVDQFAPVKEISSTAYGLLRLAKGASGAFESLLHGGLLKLSDNVYDFDETKRGGVVDKLLIPLQGEHHDFMRWVAANRAERLLGDGKEHLFSPQDVADLKTLATGQAAFDYTVQNGVRKGKTTRDRAEIYRDSLITFNTFNKNVLDMAEQSGLIDGASRQIWESEFYVPFYRVADDSDGGIRGMNIKGGVVRQQAFKALKGGKNALNADLLDNTLMNWAHLLDASAKNRAAKATIEAAENLGIATGGDQATLKQMGSSINNKNGVVWFMDGGQKRYSLIDNQGDGPFLMTAINSLEYAGMRSPIMNAMGFMKSALTIGVTASPFFKVRNLIRDSVSVIGLSGINPNALSNVAQGWKLTDPKSDAYFRLLAGGGTIHFGTMLEGSEAKRTQALVESSVDAGTILNDDHKIKAFYRKFIEPGITAYNELGNRGEAVNRASLYDQLRKQGMNHADASLQARDLMDFSMQGSFTSIRFLTQVVPFMNARLQGLYKMGRSAKEDPQRMAVVIGALSLISVGLLAAYGDDDDWRKRADWDRNNFWWFKFGGTAFRIPKPFELGAVATLAERGFELAFDKEMTGKNFRKQVMTLLGDNLSMNPIPQVVKPILDVYANKDSFSGNPIESMSMERLQSEYRFNDRTSMTARAASTAMNTVTGVVGVNSPSPVQIDHMLRGYFGWLGTFIVGAADVIARPASSQKEQATPDYWKVATGSMISDLRDAPSKYVSNMYDQAKVIEQAYGTYRMLQKTGNFEEAASFRVDHATELNQYHKVEGIKRLESKFNERIRVIERSSMDGNTKRERIRAIQAQKERAAKQLAPI